MPELPRPAAPEKIPPVVATMLANPEALKRFQDSIAAMCERAAAPLVADFQASAATSLAAAFASAGGQQSVALMLERTLAPYKKLTDQMGARSLASYVGSMNLPRVYYDAPAVIPFSPVRSPNVALVERIEAVVTREIGPVATSAQNIDRNLSSLANGRGWDRLTLILASVSTVAVVVGTIFGILLFTR